jgi:hypothetical protein
MNNIKFKIQKLVKLDQKNIKDFCSKKISKNEYLDLSINLSKNFLSILKQFGFPYRSIVSSKAYLSGVTLALHLDLPDLKKVYNKYIRESTQKEVLAGHRIIFVDKIRVLSGKSQLYGSQYKIVGKKIELLSIKDPKTLDKRRSNIGVEPLSKYLDRAKRSL